ncbi:MAG: hypothetical protein LBD91_00155 [Prevotellaceae bacterium]|nr:hypothetical protein [Prevotellaceae bacterium]
MYKFTIKSLVVLVFFATSLSLAAQEPEKKERENDPSQVVQSAQLAVELANYGYAHQAVLSLVESARIIAEHPFKALTPTRSEPSMGNAGQKTPKVQEISVEKLLADARNLAQADPILLAVVDKTEKEIQTQQSQVVATKGRVLGPARVSRRVYANSTYTDYVVFEGQELAEVLVVGDGDTDLDLYVYDENNNSIGSDTDYTDTCYVSFTPKWTGSFKVVVKNRGNVYNDYTLLTN